MIINANVSLKDIIVTELTKGEFCARRECFDLIIGLDEYDGGSQLCYYGVTCCSGLHSVNFALVNRFLGIHPQIELLNGKIIIGNNNRLSIVNIATKEVKEFPIFTFYEFKICRDLIVVIGELSAFCLKNDEVLWVNDGFDDIIDIESIENDILTLVTYEDKKEIRIDINTGKIVRS